MYLLYFKLHHALVPCWRLFDTVEEAAAYARERLHNFPGVQYKILRKL